MEVEAAMAEKKEDDEDEGESKVGLNVADKYFGCSTGERGPWDEGDDMEDLVSSKTVSTFMSG